MDLLPSLELSPSVQPDQLLGNFSTNGTDDVFSEASFVLTENYGSDLDAILFVGYPDWLLQLATACCWIFALVGVPGNLITIAALARCKKVRNATALFIMNLSLSDLLFCCVNLPLAASTFHQRAWTHGVVWCGLFPLLRYGLLAVSLLSVLAITVNRYVMIGHPRLYPRLYRHRNIGWMLAFVWLFGFGALVPTLCGGWGHFGLDPHVGSCTIIPGANGSSPKEFLFIVAFLIPCLSIAVCYARIYYIVRKTALRSRGAGLNAGLPTVEMAPLKHDRSSAYESDAGDHCAIYPANPTTNGVIINHYQPDGQNNSTVDFHNRGANNGNGDMKSAGFYDMRTSHAIGIISASVPDPHLLSPHSPVTLTMPNLMTSQHRHLTPGDVIREPESSSGIESSAEQEENGAQHNGEEQVNNHSPTSYRKNRTQKGFGSPRSERSFGSAQAVIRRSKRYRRPGAPERHSVITTSTSSLGHPGRMSTKDRKLLRMILVIFLSFLICYLPITVTKIFKNLSNYKVLNISGYLLIYLTTCINPIIYVVMSSEYRQAYKNLLMCKGCRRTSNVTARATSRRGTIKA